MKLCLKPVFCLFSYLGPLAKEIIASGQCGLPRVGVDHKVKIVKCSKRNCYFENHTASFSIDWTKKNTISHWEY
jgi:hypothetical protein